MSQPKLVIGAVLLLALIAGLIWQNRARLWPVRRAAYPPFSDVYLGLRSQILQGSRIKFGLPPTNTATEPWGVVMDWGVQNGTATVMALSDGSASIYLSSGGGSIGGQGQEQIRKAAQRAVAIAAEFQGQARPTTSYPLPEHGKVIFYILNDAGVFTASGTQDEFRTHRHAFSKLGDAMQEIVTQYRLLQTKNPP